MKDELDSLSKLVKVPVGRADLHEMLLAVGLIQSMSVIQELPTERYHSFYGPFIDVEGHMTHELTLHLLIDPNISPIISGFPFHKQLLNEPVIIFGTNPGG